MPHRKKNILLQCNSLDLGQLIDLIESQGYTVEEFKIAGLGIEKVSALELQFCNTLSIERLVEMVKGGILSLKDLQEEGLEQVKLKELQLKFCNTLKKEKILEIIQSKTVTLEEFKIAGLNNNLIAAVSDIINPLNSKLEKIKEVVNKNTSAYNIRKDINNDVFTFNDLIAAGLNQKTIEALNHYSNNTRINRSYKLTDLPPMQEERTDVYFIGMPGSGKSTMLAGLSNAANELGIRYPETNSVAGTKYQDLLIEDLMEGVLPEGTSSGSYNYIPTSFKDAQNCNHPFNIIEVPGENYIKMNEDGEINEFLKYIESTENKKILIFVVDSFKKGKQALVYVNIINMFKSKGILEKTDAIYVVVNKFDIIKENKYKHDTRAEENVAHDFLKDEYLVLLNNIIEAKNKSKKKFKIKIFPYSIGSVSYASILDNFEKKYSEIILEHLMFDSFKVI